MVSNVDGFCTTHAAKVGRGGGELSLRYVIFTRRDRDKGERERWGGRGEGERGRERGEGV